MACPEAGRSTTHWSLGCVTPHCPGQHKWGSELMRVPHPPAVHLGCLLLGCPAAPWVSAGSPCSAFRACVLKWVP
jgi:hypothetical protein